MAMTLWKNDAYFWNFEHLTKIDVKCVPIHFTVTQIYSGGQKTVENEEFTIYLFLCKILFEEKANSKTCPDFPQKSL